MTSDLRTNRRSQEESLLILHFGALWSSVENLDQTRPQSKLFIIKDREWQWNKSLSASKWNYCFEIPDECHIASQNYKGIRTPGVEKLLLVESEILGFGTRNTTQKIRNPTTHWIPESTFHGPKIRNPVPGIRNPQRVIQDATLSWIPLYGATQMQLVPWVPLVT